MAVPVAHGPETASTGDIVRYLHGLVTNGPRDLDIAQAMSGYGYDEVKWAEGQGVLAELVSSEVPLGSQKDAAAQWYREAARVARNALASEPWLLAKLGLTEVLSE